MAARRLLARADDHVAVDRCRRLLATGVLLLLAACGAPAPGDERVVIQVGPESVRVQVVRHSEQRRTGLQGVTALGDDEGMLFLYRKPGRRSIWMKDCRIDLDVAFLEASGRIVQLATLRAPRSVDEPPQRTASTQPAIMVLELPAGWFERRGLGIGTQVTIPAAIDRMDSDP